MRFCDFHIEWFGRQLRKYNLHNNTVVQNKELTFLETFENLTLNLYSLLRIDFTKKKSNYKLRLTKLSSNKIRCEKISFSFICKIRPSLSDTSSPWHFIYIYFIYLYTIWPLKVGSNKGPCRKPVQINFHFKASAILQKCGL